VQSRAYIPVGKIAKKQSEYKFEDQEIVNKWTLNNILSRFLAIFPKAKLIIKQGNLKDHSKISFQISGLSRIF